MNGAQKFFQPVSGGSWNSHGRKAIFAILDDSTALMPALVMAFVLILTVVICSTRIYSGLYLTSRDAGKGGARTVGMLPYWIPFLGHIVTLSKGPDKLIQKIRDRSSQGLFALNIFGQTHNIIYSPALIKGIYQQRPTTVEFESVVWYIICKVFGASSSQKQVCVEPFKIQNEVIIHTLLRGPHFVKMVSTAVGNMEEQIPNLVSFTSSPIDQSPWERVSNTILITPAGDPKCTELVAETNLCALVRELMGHMAMPSLMGRAFLENYPDAVQDLWQFDRGFGVLAIGLPGWFPIPNLAAAHQARRRLYRAVAAFQHALDDAAMGVDPGPMWGDMDDVSALMKQRGVVWREHKEVSARSRVAADLSVIWAMNVNANLLCFWLLLRILSDSKVLAVVRKEIEAYVTVEQPDTTLGVPEPPRLKIRSESLCSSCPYLKASYFEALRLDSANWTFKRIAKDFVITDTDARPPIINTIDDHNGNDKKRLPDLSFHFKAGGYIEIPHDMHHTDPRYFAEPDAFRPERFIVEEADEKPTIKIGTLRPYGGGENMCKGRTFAERECLACVAGILAMWDFEPVGTAGGKWKIPGHRKASAVALPQEDVRVRIKRRVL